MDRRLERILPRVQKPARYTGGEYNQIIKNKDEVELRLAFCFPDTYEIGMSNLGMKILYKTMNSLPFVWCERAFAPWGDMYEEMKKANMPLYALESGDSLDQFDALAFSIGYEMAYTTVLDMLDMAGIPLRSADRPELLPIVFAGGSAWPSVFRTPMRSACRTWGARRRISAVCTCQVCMTWRITTTEP